MLHENENIGPDEAREEQHDYEDAVNEDMESMSDEDEDDETAPVDDAPLSDDEDDEEEDSEAVEDELASPEIKGSEGNLGFLAAMLGNVPDAVQSVFEEEDGHTKRSRELFEGLPSVEVESLDQLRADTDAFFMRREDAHGDLTKLSLHVLQRGLATAEKLLRRIKDGKVEGVTEVAPDHVIYSDIKALKAEIKSRLSSEGTKAA